VQEGVAISHTGGPVWVSPRIFFKFYMQIPAFWHTFSQKINSCESAKYHTFSFQVVLRAPITG